VCQRGFSSTIAGTCRALALGELPIVAGVALEIGERLRLQEDLELAPVDRLEESLEVRDLLRLLGTRELARRLVHHRLPLAASAASTYRSFPAASNDRAASREDRPRGTRP